MTTVQRTTGRSAERHEQALRRHAQLQRERAARADRLRRVLRNGDDGALLELVTSWHNSLWLADALLTLIEEGYALLLVTNRSRIEPFHERQAA